MYPKYRVPFIQTEKHAVAQIIKYPDVCLLDTFLMVFRGILFDVWNVFVWEHDNLHTHSGDLRTSVPTVAAFLVTFFDWFSKLQENLQKKSIDVYLWKRHTSPSLCTDTLKLWLAVMQHWCWSLAVVHCDPPSYFYSWTLLEYVYMVQISK